MYDYVMKLIECGVVDWVVWIVCFELDWLWCLDVGMDVFEYLK